MKIGFFDSGLGGLIILDAVRRHMPEYDYLFFGDTANLPYGDKSEEEIHALTYRGIKQLFDAGALIVIVACNTASSASVRKHQDDMLRREYPDRKLLGVIIPTVEELDKSESDHTLLIGTERTVSSRKYEIELKKIDPRFTLLSHATPALVPLIESGDIASACTKVTELLTSTYPDISTLVLGCTHYTLLKECLRGALRGVTVISQDEIIPQKLHDYLRHHPEIEGRLSKQGSIDIHLSAENTRYDMIRTTIRNLEPKS